MRAGGVGRGVLMVMWRPTPGVHVLPLGVYSTPSILPTALEPLYVSLTLHVSTWGGSRKLPQPGRGEPGCQARPKDTKALPLSTAPARRRGKGRAGRRHSASKGPEPGGSDVQRVIE